MRLAWERLRRRAALHDSRLHDLRHEAVSRFLSMAFPEVALISGHRDPRMLSRYTHLRPKKVAEKLASVRSRYRWESLIRAALGFHPCLGCQAPQFSANGLEYGVNDTASQSLCLSEIEDQRSAGLVVSKVLWRPTKAR